MEVTLLKAVAIVVAGMMTGNELCVSIVNARLRKLEDRAHFESARALAVVFGAVMPFWYAATLLLTSLAAFYLRGSGTAATLADIAAALWLVSVIYTVTCLVPINNRITAWEWDTRPPEWAAARRRWDRLHVARVALLTLAFTFLVLACLLARTGH